MICPLCKNKVTKESNCRGCKLLSDTFAFASEQLSEGIDKLIAEIKAEIKKTYLYRILTRGGK